MFKLSTITSCVLIVYILVSLFACVQNKPFCSENIDEKDFRKMAAKLTYSLYNGIDTLHFSEISKNYRVKYIRENRIVCYEKVGVNESFFLLKENKNLFSNSGASNYWGGKLLILNTDTIAYILFERSTSVNTEEHIKSVFLEVKKGNPVNRYYEHTIN